MDLLAHGFVRELLADLFQAVRFKEGGWLGDEENAAAVGKCGCADGLVVHPEMLAELLVHGVGFRERYRRLHVHMLVRDELPLHQRGCLFSDPFHHSRAIAESEQANRQRQNNANGRECDISSP